MLFWVGVLEFASGLCFCLYGYGVLVVNDLCNCWLRLGFGLVLVLVSVLCG